MVVGVLERSEERGGGWKKGKEERRENGEGEGRGIEETR